MLNKNKYSKLQIATITVCIALYALVAIVSISHLYDFLIGADPGIMALLLSLAYGLGTASSIFVVFIAKTDKTKILAKRLFYVLLFMEVLANVFYAFVHANPETVTNFSELCLLHSFSVEAQRRIYAIVYGVPIVILSMGYVHIMNNYFFLENESNVKNKQRGRKTKTKNSNLTGESWLTNFQKLIGWETAGKNVNDTKQNKKTKKQTVDKQPIANKENISTKQPNNSKTVEKKINNETELVDEKVKKQKTSENKNLPVIVKKNTK